VLGCLPEQVSFSWPMHQGRNMCNTLA